VMSSAACLRLGLVVLLTLSAMAASGGGSVCVETTAYHRGAAALAEQHGQHLPTHPAQRAQGDRIPRPGHGAPSRSLARHPLGLAWPGRGFSRLVVHGFHRVRPSLSTPINEVAQR
jgi:hypothetical protein